MPHFKNLRKFFSTWVGIGSKSVSRSRFNRSHVSRCLWNGARQRKARRGELRLQPPTGYVWGQKGYEMDPDENFRIILFKDLHFLLKDNGILLVGESMIPDTFAPKQKFQLFDITHKFFEAGSARFYNEETFKKFVESTPFSKAEFIKEGGTYFWAVRK